MPLSEPYTPQEVKTLTASQAPMVNRPFIEAGDHLYWVHSPVPGLLAHRTKKGWQRAQSRPSPSPPSRPPT